MIGARPYPETLEWRVACRRRRTARVASLLALCVAVGLGLGAGQSLLRLRTVQVASTDRTVAEEVRGKLVVPPGANLLTTPVASFARQAEQCPRVARAEVERRPPGTLKLTVIPRQPLFAVRQERKYVLVDGEGMCLYRCARPRNELLRVQGLDATPLEIGGRLTGEWLERSRAAAEALAGVKKPAPWILDVTRPPEMAVVSASGARGIIGIDGDVSRRVRLFVEVLQQLEARGDRVAVMELRTRRPIWWPRPGGAPRDAHHPA